MSASEFLHCRPSALLDTVGGDRNTFLLLVDIFKRDTAEKLGKMRQALAKGDRAQLAFSAHALKGTVGPTGADALLQQLIDFETACRDPQGVCAEASLDGFEREVEVIRAELERFAANLT